MNETSDAVRTAQQARARALIVPREHGAWGLLLVPLFTGVVAGYSSEHRIWPLLLFTVAALSLFWLRTPVESLIGTGSLTANTARERQTALIASILLVALASACLTGLLWKGQNLQLLLLGGATAFALLLQSVLRSLGRKTRMAAQLVGAIGLTCTAPAAYYLGTGRLSERAFILWAANWIFAGNQIHFVQLRIHSARASTFSHKFAQAKLFLLAQPVFFASLIAASFWGVLPPLVIVAFVPALVRGTLWFFRKPESLDVRSLGWSEMKHGVVFGVLLAVAFIYS
ncbi:MAG: YwiC-like family protein [Terriglobales bacterium]